MAKLDLEKRVQKDFCRVQGRETFRILMKCKQKFARMFLFLSRATGAEIINFCDCFSKKLNAGEASGKVRNVKLVLCQKHVKNTENVGLKVLRVFATKILN